ncbi:MAG: hypothetical protein K6E76_02610 [Patescibacteria group bacterium]|nr:hypothetical protein [Patescibacteria group bacterium]
MIHNYKEQNIFTEDVNEDVLKRIPLDTWREFNNLFGELLEKKPSDSTKCKDLMS